MRLALVSPTYPPETGWGGIGTYVHHLARGLVSRGHEVNVLCGYRAEASVEEGEPLRIIRKIPMQPTTALERSARIARLLEEEIARRGIELVEFGEYGGDGTVFQRRNPTFPVVVKLHCPTRLCSLGEGTWWQRWARRHYLAPSARLTDRLERESVRMAQTAVAPSHWLFRAVRALGWSLPKRAEVVANPFGGWPGLEIIRTSWPGVPRVLVLGRLARIKGADLLPEIFEKVWCERPETQFEVVGQDTLRTRSESWQEYLLGRIAPGRRSQVIFRGGMAYAEVPVLLTRHQVALFASRFESASYTLLECMWAGLACVVGSQGGAQEMGEPEVSVLNSTRDPREIARNVLRLLADDNLRVRLGRAAQERVRQVFDPGSIAAQMEMIYRCAQTAVRRRLAVAFAGSDLEPAALELSGATNARRLHQRQAAGSGEELTPRAWNQT